MNRKRKPYHHGNLRQSLIDAAVRHLTRGIRVTDLSLRTLAQELGVSPAAPYRHFQSLEALVAAVAVFGFRKLVAEMEAKIPDSGPTARTLEALGEVYVSFALRSSQLYRAMFHLPAPRLAEFPDLQSVSARALDLLSHSLKSHQHALGGGHLSHDEALLACWAYVHGLADLGLNQLSPNLDPDDIDTIRRLTTALTRGL